jgi:excisionase family DNA binding protein
MADKEFEEFEDGWMTLAEIAAELRMSPATIRSWVSQGTLRATRAGKRKWLVRRSEFERMLAGRDMYEPDRPDADIPEGGWRPSDAIESPHRSPHWPKEALHGVRPESWLRWVDEEWRRTLWISAMAPPNEAFAARLRDIAEASARKAAALADLEEEPGAWWKLQTGFPNLQLSYELRPGGTRPGPSQLWNRFDRVVGELSSAMENHSVPDEKLALERLSLVVHDIAEALLDLNTYPWPGASDFDRAENHPTESGGETPDQDASNEVDSGGQDADGRIPAD